jgi:hypothetical protein
MIKTQLFYFFLAFGVMSTYQIASGTETVSEKAKATGNDVKRGAKKGWNRTKEAVCMKGDLKCAADKVRNRTQESKDTVVDKSKEAKNKVD